MTSRAKVTTGTDASMAATANPSQLPNIGKPRSPLPTSTPAVMPSGSSADAGTTSDAAPASGSDDAGSSFDNLDMTDASLKGTLGILRVGSEPTPNNLLSVFVGLKNKTAHILKIEVQTIYKDKSGNELNAGSWIPMTLKPHEETEYRSASISELATDFLVRVRRAQEPSPDAQTNDGQ